MGKKLDLRFSVKGGLQLAADGFSPVLRENGDFWRAFLDTGEIRELAVYAHDQTPSKTDVTDTCAVYRYDSLTAEDGVVYPIVLEVTLQEIEGTVHCSAVIENHGDCIVNELQLPFVDAYDYGCDPAEEVLYVPDGIGSRTPNLRQAISWCHTEYMSADYKSTWMTHTYPPTNGRMLSMPWVWHSLQT